jgi:hypothetical protein
MRLARCYATTVSGLTIIRASFQFDQNRRINTQNNLSGDSGVVLDRSTKKSFAAWEQAIRELPQVLECFLIAGEVNCFPQNENRGCSGIQQI